MALISENAPREQLRKQAENLQDELEDQYFTES
jgi:hypothetical protein